MPIKGISETRRFPRLGKIRLGEKRLSPKGAEYPKAVDYFVVKEDEATPASAVKAFRSVYGDKPRALRIMFPSNDPESFFPQWYKCYRASIGLYCMGDGETATRRQDDGTMAEVPCPCPLLDSGECRQMGHLMFFLPDVPGLGVWQLDTSSYHSIVNINSGVAMIKAITGGRIAMIPLTLRLVPREVSPDGKKKVVYVLDLVQEEATLKDVLLQSRRSVAEILGIPEQAVSASLPVVDHNEVPEDLVPASIQATLKHGNEQEAEAVDDAESGTDPEPKTEPDEERFNRLCDQLGYTAAKRTLLRRRAQLAGLTLSQAADKLEEELAKKKAQPAGEPVPQPEQPAPEVTASESEPDQRKLQPEFAQELDGEKVQLLQKAFF